MFSPVDLRDKIGVKANEIRNDEKALVNMAVIGQSGQKNTIHTPLKSLTWPRITPSHLPHRVEERIETPHQAHPGLEVSLEQIYKCGSR